MWETGELQTIWEMLQCRAVAQGEAPAVLAPGRAAQNYGAVATTVRRVAGELRRRGVGRSDVVAIVLPNGPEMAVAFLAVAGASVAAPLNPSYTEANFHFYLEDLRAKAVVVGQGSPAAIRLAAEKSGIPQWGWEELAGAGEGSVDDWPDAESTALLLHTSGTTSRPKLVPLTQRNLLASARNIAETLQLQAVDRCLNIMPLFHIHGLAAALLASLYAGASVVCSDGVFAQGFFAWLEEFTPSWYTAVPTMHQGILAQAAQQAGCVARGRLRLIRSSSAALPPVVKEELEAVFGVPVVEAYGMTEAAHQMCCNPLPPRVRKAGSVGPAAGPEVAVMDAQGRLLGTDAVGEVVIRGENVTPGYVANEAANAEAFAHGWFHTGDQGRLDADGYLHLTGRLKELINRGGEKIAPREIDEALLQHAAVRQALAFAVPHAQLGEEVGAAVELHAGQTVSEQELRDWVAERLASFQVPRVIRVVEKIPTGPTGKLQRIGLAGKLGIETIDDAVRAAYVAPRNAKEAAIAAIWQRYFPGEAIGVETRFEALGGDSLLAARMLAELETELGGRCSMQRFLSESTVACLAREMREEKPLFVRLRAGGSCMPLLCLPGHDGSLLGLTRMVAEMRGGGAVWGVDLTLRPEGKDLEEVVAGLLQEWRQRFPQGPYRLLGVCQGGSMAWEMAQQLEAAGEQVELLFLVDALNPAWQRHAAATARWVARGRQLGHKLQVHGRALAEMPGREGWQYLRGRVGALRKNYGELAALRVAPEGDAARQLRSWVRRHEPKRIAARAVLVRMQGKRLDAPMLGWQGLAGGGLELLDLPFATEGALSGDNARRMAGLLDERWQDG